MKIRHFYFAAIISTLLCALFWACSSDSKTYVIGVSQCSEDSWRSKLHDELDMATYFNEGVTLRYASSNDDANLQEQQINEMIDQGIDLLIVSPSRWANSPTPSRGPTTRASL